VPQQSEIVKQEEDNNPQSPEEEAAAEIDALLEESLEYSEQTRQNTRLNSAIAGRNNIPILWIKR